MSNILLLLEKMNEYYFAVQQESIYPIGTPLQNYKSAQFYKNNGNQKSTHEMKTNILYHHPRISTIAMKGPINGQPTYINSLPIFQNCPPQLSKNSVESIQQSDYQVVPISQKVERTNGNQKRLSNGGGLHIVSNKMNEKQKSKGNLRSTQSKLTLSSIETTQKQSKSNDNLFESEKIEHAKHQINSDWIVMELSRMSERIARNQEKINKFLEIPQNVEVQQNVIKIDKIGMNFDEKLKEHCLNSFKQVFVKLETINKEIESIKEEKAVEKVSFKTVNDQMKLFNEELKTKFNNELSSLSIKLKDIEMKINQKYNQFTPVKSSVKKFEGKMLSLQYEQKLLHINKSNGLSMRISEKQNEIETSKLNSVTITSKIYFIDTDGYLLDKNKYYLLNRKNEQIRLSQKQIELLRSHSLL